VFAFRDFPTKILYAFLASETKLDVQVYHNIISVTEEAVRGELKFTTEYAPKLTPVISVYLSSELDTQVITF
jgi:hypothetical protein